MTGLQALCTAADWYGYELVQFNDTNNVYFHLASCPWMCDTVLSKSSNGIWERFVLNDAGRYDYIGIVFGDTK